MSDRKQWSDYTRPQRVGIAVTSAVQIALAVTAWRDLARRPTVQIKGPKPLWAVVIGVNWIGPISYFLAGRRRSR